MVYGHLSLRQHSGDIIVAARAAGVDLLTLDLNAEVDPMPGGKLILHPEVFAELQRLFLMSRRAYAMKTQPLEEGHQQPLRKLILARRIKKGSQLLPLNNFFPR